MCVVSGRGEMTCKEHTWQSQACHRDHPGEKAAKEHRGKVRKRGLRGN